MSTGADGRLQALVSYTYTVKAAPWVGDAEVQRVFPLVAGVLRGAGNAQLEQTFTQAYDGWHAAGLQGS